MARALQTRRLGTRAAVIARAHERARNARAVASEKPIIQRRRRRHRRSMIADSGGRLKA